MFEIVPTYEVCWNWTAREADGWDAKARVCGPELEPFLRVLLFNDVEAIEVVKERRLGEPARAVKEGNG